MSDDVPSNKIGTCINSHLCVENIDEAPHCESNVETEPLPPNKSKLTIPISTKQSKVSDVANQLILSTFPRIINSRVIAIPNKTIRTPNIKTPGSEKKIETSG